MDSIKMKIAQAMMYTSVFQTRAANKYFDSMKKRYEVLPSDEKPKRLLGIRNHKNKTEQLVNMFENIEITIRPDKLFQTWIDTGLYVGRFYSMTDNVPPYYPVVLDNSLADLKKEYERNDGQFFNNELSILNGVENYINRVIKEIDKVVVDNQGSENLKRTRIYFQRMLNQKTASFEEALQRILFWSSLFWQSQHQLVGLGRLDKILEKYPSEASDRIAVLKEFYQEMHRYYAFKSSSTSLGDTGQIVILGGLEEDGTYFCNELTYDFITAIKELHLPDPKVLLRVSSNMPDDLLPLALECIQTGIGCPLLANDDIIIPALIDFGYAKEDAHNYVTSACWEPLVYGKSLEKNNIKIINFADPLTKVIEQEDFKELDSFDLIIECYLKELRKYLDSLLCILQDVKWEMDPLASLFTQNCFEKGLDVSQGGAEYNDYGILSVGMSNTINSLLNIKKLVFEEDKYSLSDIKEAVTDNYSSSPELKRELRSSGYYGRDDQEVLEIVNTIIGETELKCKEFKNKFGGKLKFGLSASNYVEIAKGTSATPDGRSSDEALRSHITATGETTYAELMNFASMLKYSGVKSNGNVVDFFVAPAFLEQNFEKFLLFLRQAIKQGFFEMQMNVVSSATLIDAKAHPENYPNLIVRVWGFSAYFKDLPEEYQNVLIERAQQSERAA